MEDGVNTIHEDVISEILLHLPPISILRFKLVSKEWYSLISNLNFLTSHSIHYCRRLPSPVMLIPRRGTKVKGSKFILLPHDDDDDEQVHLQSSSMTLHSNFLDHVYYGVLNSPRFFIYDSCNGLLLYAYTYIVYKQKDLTTLERKRIYHVCNPITNHFVQLPDIEEQLQVEKQPEICLLSMSYGFIAFDPSISLIYKVFMINDVLGKHCKLYVYSSETRSWKHLTHFTSTGVSLSKVVLLNGVAYWSYLRTIEDVLLCIDVEKESFWFLPLPPKPIGDFMRRFYFGECGGRVRLIDKKYIFGDIINGQDLGFPYNFDIMELDHQQQQQQQQQQKEDGRRNCIWSVKYRVSINTLPTGVNINTKPTGGGYDHLIGKKRHLSVLHHYKKTKNKGERQEEEVLLLNIDDTMVIPFNLDCKTFGKEIMVPNSRQLQLRHYTLTDVLSYTMTLFPLL